MRIIIAIGILIALAVIGATYTGGSDNTSDEGLEDPSPQSNNKSKTIFYTLKAMGISVENVYTSSGGEIKNAFNLKDSKIDDNSTIAFIMFRYSPEEGVDKKVEMALATIYATLYAEPSIDGVLVMPYDPSGINTRTSMVYTNRSYAQEVALQNLSLRKFYNRFDVYPYTIAR